MTQLDTFRNGLSLASFFLFVAIIGCETPENPAMVAARNATLFQDDGKKPVTLTEAKNTLESDKVIVLIGKVGSGSLDPFEKGKSVFVLSEVPEDHAGSADHNADECPFCRRKMAEAPLAQIEMVDANGQAFPFGAADLFKMRAGQVVIVSGHGQYDKESDMLHVKGRSLRLKP